MPQKKFSYEIQIAFTSTQTVRQEPPPIVYNNLTVLPQVRYLGDGHYHVDFGIQQLYISDVSSLLVLRHEEEVEPEVPEVKIKKETK